MRIASRSVSANSARGEGQREHVFAQRVYLGAGPHGLEARIEQCRVYSVSLLLRADLAGQRHFGEHGPGRLLAGAHSAQPGERRAVLNATNVQRRADLGAVFGLRVPGEQRRHVVGGWRPVRCGVQHRAGLPDQPVALIGVDSELHDTRSCRRCRHAHGGVFV